MCGIIGYIGNRNALPIAIDGLERLEYRGYDSVGIAIICDNKLAVRKNAGRLKDLKDRLINESLKGNLSIGHCRWATHGRPNHANAHPHTDCKNRIAVVHNGIIENFQALKSRLIKEGHIFKSETDTEVVAHLIEKYYKGDIFNAAQQALKELKGAYALGIICSDEPERLIAGRLGCPLVIGIGKDENFIASDVPAILSLTRKAIYLGDGELASLTSKDVSIFKQDGASVKKKIETIKWDILSAQKGGFKHFMLKEIHEQPHIIERLSDLQSIKGCYDLLKEIDNIVIVACGTAYHAGLVGRYAIEELARMPVSCELSSEFRYRNPIINNKTLVIAISQSGETADTLAAIKEAKSRGAKVISVCNVVGSSVVRESDICLYTYAGPEISVASTKAYTAQLSVLYCMSIYLAYTKKTITQSQKMRLLQELKRMPQMIEKVLDTKETIRRVAERNSHFGCFLYLGRNINYPSALEGALKLKEISYIPAEGYAAGEMKHGPIALIDEYRAVVCVAIKCKTYDKMVSNIQEIRARQGKVVAIATEGDNDIKSHCSEAIYIPRCNELFSPLLVAIPLQLFAYYAAVKRGCDVDKPRNLAKSVTVE